jgi:hypothetical protein
MRRESCVGHSVVPRLSWEGSSLSLPVPGGRPDHWPSTLTGNDFPLGYRPLPARHPGDAQDQSRLIAERLTVSDCAFVGNSAITHCIARESGASVPRNPPSQRSSAGRESRAYRNNCHAWAPAFAGATAKARRRWAVIPACKAPPRMPEAGTGIHTPPTAHRFPLAGVSAVIPARKAPPRMLEAGTGIQKPSGPAQPLGSRVRGSDGKGAAPLGRHSRARGNPASASP